MPPEAPKKKRKGARLIFRIFLMLVISLLLGGSVYMLNAKRLVRNAMPMPFGYGFSVILSGSMEPTLSVNDLVIVHAQEDYAVGDVVVYQSGHALVIHRIIQFDGEAVITQGDANNIEDAPVARSEIKGRMVGVIPNAGNAVHFLQSPLGIILVLTLAIFLLNRSWSKEKAADDKDLDVLKEEIRRLKELEEQKLQQNEPEAEEPEQPAPEAEEPEQPAPETEEPEAAVPELEALERTEEESPEQEQSETEARKEKLPGEEETAAREG